MLFLTCLNNNLLVTSCSQVTGMLPGRSKSLVILHVNLLLNRMVSYYQKAFYIYLPKEEEKTHFISRSWTMKPTPIINFSYQATNCLCIRRVIIKHFFVVSIVKARLAIFIFVAVLLCGLDCSWIEVLNRCICCLRQ